MDRVSHKRALATACWLALFSATAAHAQQAQPVDSATAADAGAQPAQVDQNKSAKPARSARKQDVATLDTVTVTGIRGSIATSAETKRESTSIVEAISAEDIGKLPDVSIAESLARLPGLAGQRVDGRAQVIAIRGLSPDFAATLLNGREQVSTGDNRGVEFDQYPAELMNAVTVYKTPDATLVGQGLSGTVNLQTIRPLDVQGRRVVFNARGEYNTLGKQNAEGKDKGYRVSASYIDQFADDTIGVALGYARLNSPFQERHYKAWWWANTAPWGMPIDGLPTDATALQGAEFWARSKDQTRDGLMGVFEFRPSDSFHSVLDLYYSKFDQKENMRGLMWPQDPWTGNNVYYTDVGTSTVSGDKLVTSGAVHNVRPVVRNDYNTRNDHLYSAGWNNVWNFAPDWTLTGDLSYSRAKRSQDTAETYAGSQSLDSMDFRVPTGPAYAWFSPGLDYADAGSILLSDPANWGHDGRLEHPRQDDEIKAARLELRRDFESGPFSAVQVGINTSRRQKKKTSTVYFADLLNGRAPVAVDSGLLLSPTELGFSGIPAVLSYDVNGALGRYYDIYQQMSTDDLRKDFTITEKIRTAYAMLDIDTDMGSMAVLRGNVGVQFVHTNQSSTAFNVENNSVIGNLERGKQYNDVLPSLNLSADFGEGRIVRFGAAKTLARPRVDDMRAAASAGVDPTTKTWSGSGGNPELEPWRAKSYDLSFEKYFGNASYVALALFYKKLDSYIYTKNIDYDFTGFTNTSAVQPISNIGNYSAPANGDGGMLRGAEFSTALEGSLLTPALEGFGAIFSASYTESSIKPNGPDTSETMTLPGLSRDVANLTLYYEKNGFSARVSERYRSDFRGEITSLFAQRSYTRILADRQTDLQLSYDFDAGSALKGTTLLFQVNNLTNSPYRTVQDGDFDGGVTAPQEYNLFGRQVLVGFSYKFE